MAIKKTYVKNVEDLPKILDLIHDCRFEVSDIDFSKKESVLSIPFSGEVVEKRNVITGFWGMNKVEIPLKKLYLRIFRVKSFTLNDVEAIGVYSFSDIAYNPDQRRLLITTNTETDMKVDVDDFEVLVEETNEITGRLRRYEFFGAEFGEEFILN